MARGSRGNNNNHGGASSLGGGRRGRSNDSSTPFSSSSYSNKGGKPAPRRPRPRNDGPRGLHDVYDYAQASTSASSKQDRGTRRALAGMKADDYSDLPSKAKGKQPKRRRNDDDEELVDQEDSDDDSDAGPIGPKVFDSDDELDASIEGSDEELDSDEAFGESDEEKFDGWTFGRGSKGNNKRKGGHSDDEEQEDQDADEGEDEGIMDLSRMLDAPPDSEDESEADASDDDDDNDHSSTKLAQHIQSYASAGSKRPTTSSDDDGENSHDEPSTKRTRRHVLSERTEAIPETEFAAAQSGSTLRLEDFMSPLSSNVDFADVRKSTKLLSNPKSSSSTSASAASKKGGGALSAPLPSVVQDRLDRSGAYSITRDEVQGWQPTINRLRDAEHLSFPLQKPAVTKQSTSGLVATFNPDGDMESSIAAMLTEGGLTEKQLAQQEDLAMNKLDPEEARARRDELRRMRMLMFRAEQKAKRVSKIKSKAYRKIHRKEKERLKAQMKELDGGSDDEGVIGEVDEEEETKERLKAERDRARERATLKHKNTSKWAKNILSARHGEHNQEARNELDAQLRRGAELRSKIQGRVIGEDSDPYSSDYSEGEDGEEGVIGDAFGELAALEAKEEAKRRKDEEEFEKVGGKKGVYNMKFMKDARERQYAAVRGEVDDFVTEMQQFQAEGGSGSESEDQGEMVIPRKDAEGGSSTYVQGNKGRALYGGNPSSTSTATATPAAASPAKKESAPKPAPAKANAGVEIGGEPTSTKPKSKKPALFTSTIADVDDNASNPWLVIDSNGHSTSKLSRKKNDSTLSAATSTSTASAAKSALRASKNAAKSSSALAQRREDESIAVDLSTNLGHQSDSDVDSDGDSVQPAHVIQNLTKKQKKLNPKHAMTAIQQRDLVSSAFAGDDVVAEFEAEKAATVAADESKIVDTRLPGWGSWTGKGIRHNNKPANPKFLKKIQGIDAEKRKDAGMDRVIISERRDKKQDKFRVKDLPYPYTSVAQYKAAMSQPLGKEWNTRIETQRLNMPRVMKKPGAVITPVVRKF
ncbi:hypothetical protein NDA13_006392 [Ustilago tritici]|nr:hypothetical protein NDA13_006392 [Ustilago tritici]